MNWSRFFEVLPKIAENPLAILAYIVVGALWIIWAHQKYRVKCFLHTISNVPKAQIRETATALGYKYDEISQLSQRDRLRLLTRRYWLIAFISTLLVGATIVALVMQAGSRRAHLEEELNQIDQMRRRLEASLDNERHGSSLLARGIEREIGFANRSMSQETRLIAQNLSSLLIRFDALHSENERSPDDSIRIRLARAILANAQLRFDDSLKELSEADQSYVIEQAQHFREIASSITLARAEAFGGKHKWNEALQCFSKVLALDDRNWRAHIGAIDCMGKLGDRARALLAVNSCIAYLSRQSSVKPDFVIIEALVQCRKEKAELLRWSGRPQDAIIEIEKVVKIREAESSYLNSQPTLAGMGETVANSAADARVDRGIILADLKRYDESFSDLDAATRFYEKKVKSEGKVELRGSLAYTLSLRGSVQSSLGHMQESIEDMDAAAQLFSNIIAVEGRIEVEENLASTLADKAIAERDVLQPEYVLKDFDASVSIRQKLVASGRSELENEFASSLTNRAIFLRSQGYLDRALADLNQAATIRRRLHTLPMQPEQSSYCLASTLHYRGLVYGMMGDNSQAFRDLDEAVRLRTELVEKRGRTDLKNELATSLIGRGDAFEKLDKPGEAATDYKNAVTTATDPIVQLIASQHRDALHLSATNLP